MYWSLWDEIKKFYNKYTLQIHIFFSLWYLVVTLISMLAPHLLPKWQLWVVTDLTFFFIKLSIDIFFKLVVITSRVIIFGVWLLPNIPPTSEETWRKVRYFISHWIPNPIQIGLRFKAIEESLLELLKIILFNPSKRNLYFWYEMEPLAYYNAWKTYLFRTSKPGKLLKNKHYAFFKWLFFMNGGWDPYKPVGINFKFYPFSLDTEKRFKFEKNFYYNFGTNPYDYIWYFQDNQELFLRYFLFVDQLEDKKFFLLTPQDEKGNFSIEMTPEGRDFWRSNNKLLRSIEKDKNFNTISYLNFPKK